MSRDQTYIFLFEYELTLSPLFSFPTYSPPSPPPNLFPSLRLSNLIFSICGIFHEIILGRQSQYFGGQLSLQFGRKFRSRSPLYFISRLPAIFFNCESYKQLLLFSSLKSGGRNPLIPLPPFPTGIGLKQPKACLEYDWLR